MYVDDRELFIFVTTYISEICHSCCTNISFFMITFLLLFLRLESKSLLIFQIAHSPPLKLIIIVNTANNDFKVGRTRSVV
jgi:hypothetical protein